MHWFALPHSVIDHYLPETFRMMEEVDSARIAAIRALVPALIAARTGTRNASLILPRLYLSNYTIATNTTELETLGITHIVSVMDFAPEACPPHIKRLHVKLQDKASADILQHLEQTTEFIHEALHENESNNVLVHCLMGISRSTTVICAYLIASNQMSAQDALEFVVKKRSIASPNAGFRAQLETYAMQRRSRVETEVALSTTMAQSTKAEDS